METFKDIKGYEGLYQISNLGNVKGLDRRGCSNYKLKGCKLKALNVPKGYLSVILYKDGKTKMLLIHRLVAEHFISNSHNKKWVNHKDCNKANNTYSNLEWVTHSENLLHAYKNGRTSTYPKEIYQYSTKTLKYSRAFQNCYQAAKEIGYDYRHLCLIVQHQRKTKVNGYYYSSCKEPYYSRN